MASNQAAWIDGKYKALEVRPAAFPTPGADEVVVKAHSIAVNPVDWKMQDGGLFSQIPLPFVMGHDVAGEIYDVGTSVNNFKKGDRVLAHCTCLLDKKTQSGAFQLYSAANSNVVSKMPADMSFAEASVLPLALSTAALGLYSKESLSLPPPQTEPRSASKAILVWGGSSSVGAVAIQLAKASGVTVLTTTSSQNLGAATSRLGADYAFDYRSPTVVDDLVRVAGELKEGGTEFVGVYDAISLPASFQMVSRVFDKLGSRSIVSTKKLATVLSPSDLSGDIKSETVAALMVLTSHKYVADAVWTKFVPGALEKGILKPLPPPMVVGKGLGSIQKGMDENKKGVSFAKVVIEIDQVTE